MMDVHLNDGMLNNVEMKQDRTLNETKPLGENEVLVNSGRFEYAD